MTALSMKTEQLEETRIVKKTQFVSLLPVSRRFPHYQSWLHNLVAYLVGMVFQIQTPRVTDIPMYKTLLSQISLPGIQRLPHAVPAEHETGKFTPHIRDKVQNEA